MSLIYWCFNWGNVIILQKKRTEGMNLFIAGTDVACSLISFVILCAIFSTKEKKKRKNKYLLLGIMSLILFSIADAISLYLDEFGGNKWLHICSNIFSYIGADFIVTLFVYYISERIREKCEFSKWYARVVLMGAIVDIGFVLSGAYSGGLFRFENGQMIYGELNNYIGFVQFVVMAYFGGEVFIKRKSLEKKFKVTIFLYFMFPLIAMIILFFDASLAFTYLASALSFLVVYVIVAQENLQASILGEKIMHDISITDDMTGLLNRKAYTDDVENITDQYPSDFVYMSFDLNGLKITNDNLGHAAGDEIIVGAAQCMRKCLGIYGSIYRTGGDEFTAILRIASKKLSSVLEAFELEVANWHGKTVDSISISYGCVKAEEIQGFSIGKVAVIADERMYRAKTDYYRKQGIDRNGQVAAYTALCNLYTKILKINITSDTYSIISMDELEKSKEKGFSNNISSWLREFGKSGQVYEDDQEDYLRKTNIEYLKNYFLSGKTSITISYRRKYKDEVKQVAMEMVQADDYKNNNQTLFLYVKNVDK